MADTVLAGNPHADKHGNEDIWSFVRGASKGKVGGFAGLLIPPESVLGRWREAAADPVRRNEAAKLAEQAQALLSGPRPAKEKDPDRILYDKLVAMDGPLFVNVDVRRLAKPRTRAVSYGLPKDRFGTRPDGKPIDGASLAAAVDTVTEVRLPAALFAGPGVRGRGPTGRPWRPGGAVPRADRSRSGADLRWDGHGPVLAAPDGAGYKRLLQGYADFRRVFPLFLCFPQVVPTDEVVCLKMFHREDEPLARLFLNAEQKRRLDHLWAEHRFISRQPVAENNYLPLFIGFVTQDQPKDDGCVLRGPAAGLPEAGRGVPEGGGSGDPEAAGRPAGRSPGGPIGVPCRRRRRPTCSPCTGRFAAREPATRRRSAACWLACWCRQRSCSASSRPRRARNPAPVNDWELATRLSYFLWSSAARR